MKHDALFIFIETNYHITLTKNQRTRLANVIHRALYDWTLGKTTGQFYESLPIDQPFTTQQAEAAAQQNGISRPTLFRLLKRTDLFEKEKHGLYSRLK